MKTMIISEFKAKCIAAVKRVQREREPILVTIRGKPVAVVGPYDARPAARVLGGQRGALRIEGDIVSVDTSGDWDLHGRPESILKPLERPLG